MSKNALENILKYNGLNKKEDVGQANNLFKNLIK